jgi:methylenetetrahydrofolate dehydrogenase (NADP+)/methenyltetrahydrofolate cyclohydrolase
MTAQIIDGKALSAKIKTELKQEVLQLKVKGLVPGLAVILVGDNPASAIYVRRKGEACQEVGIASTQIDLPLDCPPDRLLGIIRELNQDSKIHGILVQLPLPAGLNERLTMDALSPAKDVDGLHPMSMGNLLLGTPTFLPCTPLGIMYMLDSLGLELKGKEAVVVGRSNIVGKPLAQLLLSRHASVTMCHSRTRDLAFHTRRAEVLVAAVGKAHMISGDMVGAGAVVIDVGINRQNGKLVGDVEFKGASERASFITPVPGGVGPMTIAMLLKNTVEAAKKLFRGHHT